MLDATDLTEDQATLLRKLLEVYPGALGYKPGRSAHALLAPLVEQGLVITLPDVPGLEPGQVAYQAAEEYVERHRQWAEHKAGAARWN
jgi:hypothetical protein